MEYKTLNEYNWVTVEHRFGFHLKQDKRTYLKITFLISHTFSIIFRLETSRTTNLQNSIFFLSFFLSQKP